MVRRCWGRFLGLLSPVEGVWTRANLASPMEGVLAIGMAEGGKRGAAAQPLRVAISGGTITPPLLETLVLLGREKTVARIQNILKRTIERASNSSIPTSAFTPVGGCEVRG